MTKVNENQFDDKGIHISCLCGVHSPDSTCEVYLRNTGQWTEEMERNRVDFLNSLGVGRVSLRRVPMKWDKVAWLQQFVEEYRLAETMEAKDNVVLDFAKQIDAFLEDYRICLRENN